MLHKLTTAARQVSGCRRISLAALSLALCAHSLSAATFYVATNGSDNNSGSSAAPLATIQKAVSLAGPGDTVLVGNGTYGKGGCASNSDYAVSISKAGTASAYITIKAQNKGQAVLDSAQVCHSYFTLNSGAAYIAIEDFTITRAYWGGIWINSTAHDIRIHGNEIEHVGDWVSTTSTLGMAGIYTGESAQNIVIDGNVIHDVGRIGGTNHDHGLYVHGTNLRMTNNIFYNNTKGWDIQTSAGLANSLIANNTMASHNPNRNGQIVFDGNNSNLTIRDNIFYKPSGLAVTSASGSYTGCVIDHNVVYGPTTVTDTGCSVSGTLSSDPKVVNGATAPYDFHLQTGSPAIDAGATIASITTDYDGNSRPQGGAYDIGAFEYVAGSSAAPVISSVGSSSVGASGATVTWTTNVQADSDVQYGSSSSYSASTPVNTTMVTSHSVALSNLSPSTTYHYRAVSKTAAGVSSASSDYTFTTAAAPAPAPSFSFRLSASPATLSLAAGSSGSAVVTASLASGTAQSVAFAISSLPAGVTGTLSAASCTPTCSSTLTLAVSTAAAAGTYQIGVTASGGGATSSAAISLTISGSTPVVGGSTPTTGLVAWWKLDEGSGSTAADASGNANTGTFRGTPAWGTGAWGTAASFTGSNYIAVPEKASLELSSAMTVSFWVSPQSQPCCQRIIAKSSSWDVKLNNQHPQFSAAGKYAAVNYVLPYGAWHHVVFTYSSGTVAAYVDGVPQAFYANTFTSGTLLPAATYGLNIGADASNASLARGLVDDVRIYNRVLSSAEVSTLYSQTPH